MNKNYGLPYKGSKSKIAEWVLSYLPPADVFVDLFCGGCAMTHAAILSGKYKRYVCNDIIGNMPRFFADAIKGKYKNETRWISREDFFRLKDTDPYVRFCWSFGNDGRNYMYSREIEPWKKALHFARVFGDRSMLEAFGIRSDGSREDIRARHEEYKRRYAAWYVRTHYMREDAEELIKGLKEKIATDKERLRQYLLRGLESSGLTQAEVGRRLGTQMQGHYFGRSQWAFPTREEYEKMQEFMPALSQPYLEVYGLQQLLQRLESLQSLQSLESLERLQRLESLERLQRLESLESNVITAISKDYAEVEIPKNSVVYCDPPYIGTDGYNDHQKGESGFDHERFYEWLRTRDFPVWVSEYTMPDDFVCIGAKKKSVSLSATATTNATEKLFVHERWADRVYRNTLFCDNDF